MAALPPPLVGTASSARMSGAAVGFLQEGQNTKENSFAIWSLGRFYWVTLNFRCPFDSLSLLAAKFWLWGT